MKQRRHWHGRQLFFVLITSLGATLAASQNPGYLAMVGPAAVRLLPPPHLPVTTFALPVASPAPTPAPIATQMKKATAAAALPKPPPVISEAASGPQTPVESAPLEPVVSPQVFLKFFNQPSTNALPPVTVPNSGPNIAPNSPPMNFTLPKQTTPAPTEPAPSAPAPKAPTFSPGQ